MNTRSIWIALVGLTGLALVAPRVDAHLEVSAAVEITSETDFYEPLAAHGTWIEVSTYGRCWRPAAVAVGWRPYCYGHWVWTDCGWYWASDEPWAWACYHYGRWVFDVDYGWVWVPGVEWAPAWVCWREGGGYVGWAPLPPAVGFRTGVIVAGDVHLAPSLFVFVETGRFLRPVRPQTVLVNNTTIINKTVNITNIRAENKTIARLGTRKVVVNEGPRVEAVAKNLRPTPVTAVAERTRWPAGIRQKAPKAPDRPAVPAAPTERVTPSKPAPPESRGRPFFRFNRAQPPEDRAIPELKRERPRPSPQRRPEPRETPGGEWPGRGQPDSGFNRPSPAPVGPGAPHPPGRAVEPLPGRPAPQQPSEPQSRPPKKPHRDNDEEEGAAPPGGGGPPGRGKGGD